MKLGDGYEHPFSLSQKDLRNFAAVTGDTNPLHINQKYAEESSFGGTVAHGMWAGAIFSRVFGNLWPGPGTVYLSQRLHFKRPMLPGHPYLARMEVIELFESKHIAVVKTEILHNDSTKVHVTGEAKVRYETS